MSSRMWLTLLASILSNLIAAKQATQIGPSTCDQTLRQIQHYAMTYDFFKIPLPFIMFSGSFINQPGHKYDCQQAGFSFALIQVLDIHTNRPARLGLCVPKDCAFTELKPMGWLAGPVQSVIHFTQADQSVSSQVSYMVFGLIAWISLLLSYATISSCTQRTEWAELPEDQKDEAHSSDQEEMQIKTEERLLKISSGFSRLFKPEGFSWTYLPLIVSSLLIFMAYQVSYKQNLSFNLKEITHGKGFSRLFVNLDVFYGVVLFCFGASTRFERDNFLSTIFTKASRLAICLMVCIIVASFTQDPFGQFWRLNEAIRDMSSWWQMILIPGGTKQICPWLWILNADFFLTLLSFPLSKLSGTLHTLLCLSVAICLVLMGYLTYPPVESFNPWLIANNSQLLRQIFQNNWLVRAGPFFIGLVFCEQYQSALISGTESNSIKRKIRESGFAQLWLWVLGIVQMILSLESIFWSTPIQHSLILGPGSFCVGLWMMMLPAMCGGKSIVARLTSSIFECSEWSHFQKIAIFLLAFGPVVIGYFTYSMQHSNYMSGEFVAMFIMGDLVPSIVLSCLVGGFLTEQIQGIWLTITSCFHTKN